MQLWGRQTIVHAHSFQWSLKAKIQWMHENNSIIHFQVPYEVKEIVKVPVHVSKPYPVEKVSLMNITWMNSLNELLTENYVTQSKITQFVIEYFLSRLSTIQSTSTLIVQFHMKSKVNVKTNLGTTLLTNSYSWSNFCFSNKSLVKFHESFHMPK